MPSPNSNEYSPKKDFYQWENHKWLNDPKNAIPSDYPLWGSFVKLRDNSLNDQIKLLNELKNTNDTKLSHDEKLIKYIYDASMSRFNKWTNNIADYSPIVNELSLLRNRVNVTSSHSEYVKSLAINASYCEKNSFGYFVDLDKGPDLVDSNNVKLDLGPGSGSLPSRSYYFDESHQESREQFLEHLNNVKNIVSQNVPDNLKLSEDFATNVMAFETKLAYISMNPSQSRLYDEYYCKSHLKDIWSNLNTSAYTKGKLDNYEEHEKEFKLSDDELQHVKLFFNIMDNELDLTNLLRTNSEKNYGHTDQKTYEVCVYDGDYLRRVFHIVLSADDETKAQLYDYLQYRIMSSMSGYCSKELHEEYFDFYNRKLSGQQEDQPFDKKSVVIANAWCGEALGKLYVKQHFSEESKADIESMINTVIHVMKKSIETNDWLTNGTKDKALKKLSTFKMKIGYPEEWKDYSALNIKPNESLYKISKKVKAFLFQTEFLGKVNKPVDKTEWHMTPQTVNAYFSPQQNEIVFPAAILQPPFYQKSLDVIDMDLEPGTTVENLGFDPVKVINFGGISAVIAHEITHGYDDQGRKFDADGNMANWWNEVDIKLFEEKTNLMGAQAEKYKYVDKNGNTHTMKPQLTMGENLADLGGLTLSLRAMLLNPSMLDSSGKPKREALRLFFRSFCNIWKCSMTEQTRVNRLITDPHAPADYRANLVRNIDEFYTAFDVTEDDPMYLSPDKRVRMW